MKKGDLVIYSFGGNFIRIGYVVLVRSYVLIEVHSVFSNVGYINVGYPRGAVHTDILSSDYISISSDRYEGVGKPNILSLNIDDLIEEYENRR